MLIQSGNFPDESAATRGGAIFFQRPPSVVRAIAPLRPTSQQTVSENAAPASHSSCDGLVCTIQERPASVERSILPPLPTRQRIDSDGVLIRVAFPSVFASSEKLLTLRPVRG